MRAIETVMCVGVAVATSLTVGCQPASDRPSAARAAPASARADAVQPEWTVMVYMNAKNNLEPDAIGNFLQMAEVGSSDKVNIVVEFGRPKEHYTEDYGAWSKTLRFRVERSMEPEESRAVMDVGNVDMGSGKQLADFVRWARKTYPAKRQMLVVWDHGQGWRFKNSRNFALKSRAARAAVPEVALTAEDAPRAPYRAISNDDDFGTVLYNRDMQESLAGVVAPQRLDVIGFDACLMAMIETAYAVRGLADYIVASEELEPGTGWNYQRWLGPLVQKPEMTAQELSAVVVNAYKEQYGDIFMTTLSAVRVVNLPGLVDAVNRLSTRLSGALPQQQAAIRDARRQCKPYGTAVGMRNGVDIGCVADAIVGSATLGPFHTEARTVRAALTAAVTANYASRRMTKGFGSFGMSFYFPTNIDDHRRDPDHAGYESHNTLMPVEYVHKEQWAPFLWKYLELPPVARMESRSTASGAAGNN
jgi:hypothetical protein